MKRFECNIIDCEGYSGTIVVSAKDYKDCYRVLETRYHVQRVCDVSCLDDYQ